jgi:hypothetical protein
VKSGASGVKEGLYALPLVCRFKSQDLFNTEPFKPFIPGLKLWVFSAPIFIIIKIF